MKMKFKVISVLLSLVLAGVLYVFWSIPDVSQLDQCFTTKLYEVNVCTIDKSYAKLNQISNIAKRAIIVSEDGTFYSHKGFDWFELKQSFLQNLKDMKYHRGGSTITQQLAKNAFLSSEKTIFRKLIEAYTAHRIEQRFSKDLILEKYLNMIEFGPKLFGIKNASQKYFLKPPSRIHLLEAVWLAHLLPNPKVYSRGLANEKLSEFSENRVRILLQRLLKYGDITHRQFEYASQQVPNFPWSHLSVEDFNVPEFDHTDQQDAIENLMQTDGWVDESIEVEDPDQEYTD